MSSFYNREQCNMWKLLLTTALVISASLLPAAVAAPTFGTLSNTSSGVGTTPTTAVSSPGNIFSSTRTPSDTPVPSSSTGQVDVYPALQSSSPAVSATTQPSSSASFYGTYVCVYVMPSCCVVSAGGVFI